MAGVSTSVAVRDNMSAVFGSMTMSINACLGAFYDLNTATTDGVSTVNLDAAREALANAEVAAQELAEQLSQAEGEQQGLNNQIARGESAANGLLGKVVGIVGAYASWKAVENTIELADELTNTTARINMMNDGLSSTEEVMQKIYVAAQNSRGSYLDMASTVAKLGTNAKDAFSSTDEIIGFAELVQKQFAIAGASTTETSNAMLQLTQALGSGVLRGDELNSIFEQAPNIIQAVADYLEVPVGSIRDMASEGAISADIVKNAMFSATDEINAKFDSMPVTWAQVGQSMRNQAIVLFQPILNMISQLTGKDEFQTVTQGIVNGFAMMATLAIPVIESMINGAAFIVENWSVIGPIIAGVAVVMGIYLGVMVIYNMVQGVSNVLKSLAAVAAVAHGTATAAEMAATTGMTAAQLSFNAALYACPLTWIILILIAVIAIIFAVVAAINSATGSSYSAIGVIVGALSTAAAFIWNIIYGLFSFVVGIFVEIYNLIATIANFMANVFNDPVGAIINLFAGLFDFILGIVESAAQLIDAVLGTDMSSAIEGFRNTVADATADLIGEQIVVMEKMSQEEILDNIGGDRWAYSDAYSWGYKKGQGIENKISNFALGTDLSDMESAISNIGDYEAATADNTGKLADADLEDNLEWVKDIAEREIIDRTVFRDIKVDMGGVNNVVNNGQDLDSIGKYLTDTIQEQMAIGAEGVFA